ncbi:hypothetical protein [Maribacter sp. Hel_I_7]|uniref:hypothetical protein n=1 Tax=Maribacter sp. Hel_I_7 TaxID=1249997 RepID=UPI00047B6A80|nr:hypothetical protein [Maribacter sp. Hel_I_7]
MPENSPKKLLLRLWIKYRWWLRSKERRFIKTRLHTFIKKNKGWLVLVPLATTTVQLWVMTGKRDKWRTKSEQLAVTNAFLVTANIGRNIEMDELDIAWYEKTQRGDSIRITGMNEKYEEVFGLDRVKSLGKTNFDLVPYEVAVVFEAMDRKVLSSGEPEDDVEPWMWPDSSKTLLYSHKWRSKYYKNRMFGFSAPLELLVKVIDAQGKMEVIEIVTDSANAVQDTIIIN